MTGLAQLDLRALLALYGGASGTWGSVMVALTILGSGWTALALVPVTLHRATRRFGVTLAGAILAQAALVWWLKAAVGRVRPWIALGLPAPIGAPRDGSFPSGHAAGSFCVAAFLAVALPAVWQGAAAGVRVRERGARGIVAAVVVLAAFIASSRVYLGAHFPCDVLGGAVLGSAVGAAAALRYLRGRPVERAAERG